MSRYSAPYLEALIAVAAVVWLTSAQLPVLGVASSALLFLLPVLAASARGGVGPGLFAALAGACSYNFFLLEPRYTFRVHQLDNLVSVFVLVAVALVTSRLASKLIAREADAQEHARLSEEMAVLSGLLSGSPAGLALDHGLDLVDDRYGKPVILSGVAAELDGAAFSSLDLAAAAWALHNGDMTGHATEVMPAADWTFLPLVPKNRREGKVLSLARPVDGSTRPSAQLEHLQQVALLLGQCVDRDSLEAERRKRELLEERDRLRRTFLASLAHDFRTPLTIITGRLAELARGNPEASDALVAAQRLDRMMTDLIGATRIESGSLVPHFESIDLVDVVNEAFNGVRASPPINLERLIPADIPFVRGDPVLLHHMISNLVDNALCHATSRVMLAATAGPNSVFFNVDDDGPGVPAAERERIFERFTRAEGSDRTDGSGLGLAIVKGFADAMGMTITVDTAPSGGARFTLAMPLAAQVAP